MKIAYIGIDLFYTALETLEGLGCEILEIFTCETDNVTEFNIKVKEFAAQRGIFCKTSRITRQDIERLLHKGCEAAICGGYYFKIPSDTPLATVNIHPSLLPEGRGAWPMAVSLLRGAQKSGVTIHKIAEGFDTGDILLQKEFLLDKNDTHEDFMKKANALLPEMLETLIKGFDELYASAVPQGDGTYWENPTESEYTVTPEMTTKEADLIFRAFFGYECIYLTEKGRTYLLRARAKQGTSEGKRFPLRDGYVEADTILAKA